MGNKPGRHKVRTAGDNSATVFSDNTNASSHLLLTDNNNNTASKKPLTAAAATGATARSASPAATAAQIKKTPSPALAPVPPRNPSPHPNPSNPSPRLAPAANASGGRLSPSPSPKKGPTAATPGTPGTANENMKNVPPPSPKKSPGHAPAQAAAQPVKAPSSELTRSSDPKDRFTGLDLKEDPVTGEYLRNVPLLAKLTGRERSKLGGCLESRVYQAGQSIVQEGEIADGFYIVQQGEVAVQRSSAGGGLQELAHLKPGDYFGEAALLSSDSKRGATVLAFSPIVKCWFLTNRQFYALFDKSRLNIQFAKRQAVSAERTDDVHEIARGGAAASATAAKTKTREQMELLLGAVRENILFAHLLPEHVQAVVQEMHRVDVPRGHAIIRQGDKGDHFYVVEQGEFQISINGTAVASRARAQCFGELALMYNAPRAATVMATCDSLVWAVDRHTFRRVVTVLGNSKLRLYQDFLKKVDLLAPLAEYERERIAEALEEVLFPPNHVVMRQGDDGNCMFIVHTGEVLVTKSEPGKAAVEVGRLKQGDCFGERALVKDEPRAATCTTLGSCLCLRLDAAHFKVLLGPLEDVLHKKLEVYDQLHALKVGAALPRNPQPPQAQRVPFNDLRVIGTLGKGSFGHVQLVRDKNTQKTYALKAVSKAQIVQTGQQAHILSEKRSMLLFDHPFMVRLYDTYKDSHRLYLLLEPVLGGELFTVLRQRSLFDEDTARFYAAHVVLAFEYMHAMNFVYRDLKPENLMLDTDGYMKVTDFGFCKELGPNGRTWTLCGTPDYLAPEIVTGKGHGKGVDWWTLGVLIYEMLASYPPFYDEDPMKTYAKIVQGNIVYPAHFSKEAIDLISKLMHHVPTKRLGVVAGGAKLIKGHPWFKGYRWDDLYAKRIKPPIMPKIKNIEDLSNFERVADGADTVQAYQDDGSNWDSDF